MKYPDDSHGLNAAVMMPEIYLDCEECEQHIPHFPVHCWACIQQVKSFERNFLNK